jgi:hypothetical protein
MLLFVSSFVFNLGLSVVVFLLFGGRNLLRRRVDAGDPTGRFERSDEQARTPIAGGSAAATTVGEMPSLDRDKILTLIGIVALVIVALAVDVDVGFVALSIAAVLSLIMPAASKDAVNKIAWPTVLLICGVVTYVSLLETLGSIDWLGEQVATIGSALLAALLICYVGGAVSAFASTTGILGALIPLAVPFLEDRGDRRGGADHRAVDLVVGGRLEPVLDERRAGGGELARREAGLRVQAADAVGDEHGRHRPTDRLAGLRRAGVALRIYGSSCTAR